MSSISVWHNDECFGVINASLQAIINKLENNQLQVDAHLDFAHGEHSIEFRNEFSAREFVQSFPPAENDDEEERTYRLPLIY